jgi:hypothetical protein
MTLLEQRCQGCKSQALLDERYQVVCTQCGLCDSFEPVPSIGSITDLIGMIHVSIGPTVAHLDMAEEERGPRAAPTGRLRAPLKKRLKKAHHSWYNQSYKHDGNS